MNCFERYYRRSYNTLNRLIEVYKNGYDKEKTLKFRQELIQKYYNNPKVAQSEFNNLMLTTMIALLGLNKEAIENTGKIIEYKKTNNSINISDLHLSSEQKIRLKEFYDSKVLSTDFDEWLSIKVNPTSDKENIDYLRRVRNALLHSNFYIDEDTDFLPIAKLKTKSYYEAELFNMKFQLFVFEYFGNIEALGLTESMYTFNVSKAQIQNKMELKLYLKLVTINRIFYKNLKTVGINSPELNLKKCSDEECYIDVKKFIKKLNVNKNAEDIKFDTMMISENHINDIISYIEKTYGDEFYKLDNNTQGGIISTHLKYELNPKMELSNWMSHFWYLYSTLGNGNFNVKFFDGDEFGGESCYPALMVLKSYLLMYRLQNNNFDEIDYNKVDFDVNDPEILLYSDVVDKTVKREDFFQNSFDKEKSNGILVDDNELWNKIICDVIRNSLAHGNIRTFTSNVNQESMIELKDIDKRKGTMRMIAMPLRKYEIFLNSEAFKPSNCFKKEETKVLLKK
ncbi:MAG: hypothetical protein IJ399_05275 [Bacilli bacterium]|nr:hypothetical protein [Bacilli bacterium]